MAIDYSTFLPDSENLGKPSGALVNEDFDFNKYDINYNPWGQGPDAEAMKQAFEDSIRANTIESGIEYNALQRKADGYKYDAETNSIEGANIYTLGYNLTADDLGPDASKYKEGDTFIQSEASLGKTSFQQVNLSQTALDVYGKEGMESIKNTPWGSGMDIYRPSTGLSAVEEYKKWRYDVAWTQIRDPLGGGENEAYTGLDYMGQRIDKTREMMTYRAAQGPGTAQKVGRAERQLGASVFSRRDIYSRSREVQANLGQQRAARAGGANVGNNQNAGVQLGG